MNILRNILIIVAVSIFFIGYHNIDLYYNYHNLAVGDETISGIIVPIDDLYMNGQRCMWIALLCLILANFINDKHHKSY